MIANERKAITPFLSLLGVLKYQSAERANANGLATYYQHLGLTDFKSP